MSVEDCKTKILDPNIQKQLFGDREIPKRALSELANAIEAIKRSADLAPEGGNFTTRVMKFLQEKTELNEVEKGIKAMNIRLIRENNAFISQPAFKGNPVEGFMARLRQTTALANGSKLNMDNMISTLKNQWFKASLGEIESKGLLPLMMDGARNGMDTDITKAVFSLTQGKVAEGSEAVQQAAEIIHNFNKMVLADHRNYGVPLRDLGSFVSLQTHDAEAVAKAGFEEWRNFVKSQSFDKEKLFGSALGNPALEEEVLHGVYDNIVSGNMKLDAYGGEAIEDSLRTADLTKSHLNKLTETRSITFTSPESEDAYRKAFGGKTLLEQMTSYTQSRAKSLGMVATWGSNPDAAFKASIDRVHDSLMASGQRELALKLKPSPDSYNQTLMDQFRFTAGYNAIPSKQSLATLGARVRMSTSLAKLGTAGIKSLGNIAQTAVAISDQTGKNVLSATLDTLMDVAKAFPAATRKDSLMRMGQVLEDTIRHVQMQSVTGVDKFAAQAMGLQSKFNGMNFLTEGAKVGFGMDFMRQIGKSSSREFEALEPKMQATFLTGGIQKADYEVLRNATVSHEGTQYLFPNEIRNLSDAEVASRAKELKLSPENYKRRMEIQYSAIINSGAMMASTTAASGEKRLASTFFGMAKLQQKGTALGELQETMGQFKAFSIQAFNSMLTTLNASPDKAALARGVLMSEGKQWLNPGYMLMSTTVLYYIAKSMQDLALGRNPKDPSKVDTWTDAMINSGMGGLYTDMISQTMQKGDLLGAAANIAVGPTFSNPLKVGVDLAKDSQGKKIPSTRTVKDTVNAVRTSLPFQNFPLVKQGLDYLQYDTLYKSLDPRASAKAGRMMEKRNKDERLSFPWKGK